ncbi:MAG: HD domain-containing protein [Planctomycetes bacterium]|nr:HD domain-containing protein [Planctomycetota bacterium]
MLEHSGSRILEALPREHHDLVRKVQKLQDIGTALSAERDLAALLSLILKESRVLTNADSGSIYIRHDEIQVQERATAKDVAARSTPYLILKITQNDSMAAPFRELKLPFDLRTVAGFVANSGSVVNLEDVYKLPSHVPFTYNRSFDQTSGYRCKSMLVVPMRNRDGEINGVIQLINKKVDPKVPLKSPADVARSVVPFDPFDEELLLSLASQAAVCVEKTTLYDDIERMFEGLVQSFTLALERRNRTTYGHCLRVAEYAVAIAQAINEAPAGRFPGARFTPDQLKELRYAALLHDIGKIAVPEAVLDKRNKLTDEAMGVIEYRFHYWKGRLRADGRLTPDVEARLDRCLRHIRQVNIPTPLAEADSGLLREIRAERFVDVDGVEKPLLTDFEYENLSIERGNLTPRERKQIEQHIVDTWEILKRVPWPKEVRHVANQAACHHEKVNGAGYPWGFRGDEIPLGGRILAIVDIFEALTAKDRPYKPAIPIDKALAILDDEAARGAIDREIYALFKERGIYGLFSGDTGFVRRPDPEVLSPKL